MQVNFADYKSGRFADGPEIYTAFALESSTDGNHWSPLARTGPERRDRANAYFELPAPVTARYVRYVHDHIGAATLAISDLRVFGNAPGKAPAAPRQVRASRECDQRNALIAWRADQDATGYNVRWGIRPDRLTLTYQVFADHAGTPEATQALRSLNVGQRYYVAVEAFNETGVSSLSPIVPVTDRCAKP